MSNNKHHPPQNLKVAAERMLSREDLEAELQAAEEQLLQAQRQVQSARESHTEWSRVVQNWVGVKTGYQLLLKKIEEGDDDGGQSSKPPAPVGQGKGTG